MESKRRRARDEGIDFEKNYCIKEALGLIKERSTAKFDETIEAIFNCNLDPRKADQSIRGVIDLPEGTGKFVRVAVLAEGEGAREALKAGADIAGYEEIVDNIQRGIIDFDVCITTPDMMPKLAKLGRILGPKGLMPNPKEGTVTADVSAAVRASKGGRVTVRPDKAGIIHSILGKASFSVDALNKNFLALSQGLVNMKPASVKNALIQRIFVSSTMGFALPVSLDRE